MSNMRISILAVAGVLGACAGTATNHSQSPHRTQRDPTIVLRQLDEDDMLAEKLAARWTKELGLDKEELGLLKFVPPAPPGRSPKRLHWSTLHHFRGCTLPVLVPTVPPLCLLVRTEPPFPPVFTFLGWPFSFPVAVVIWYGTGDLLAAFPDGVAHAAPMTQYKMAMVVERSWPADPPAEPEPFDWKGLEEFFYHREDRINRGPEPIDEGRSLLDEWKLTLGYEGFGLDATTLNFPTDPRPQAGNLVEFSFPSWGSQSTMTRP